MISRFVSRHKPMAILFFVSCWLLIKNSSIPYLIEPSPIIEFLLTRPEDSFWNPVAELVTVFASAFATSIVFYYAVEFVPGISRELSCEAIIQPQISSLQFYCSSLMGLLNSNIQQDDMGKYILEFNNVSVPYIMTGRHNGRQISPTYETVKLVNECSCYRDLILKKCEQISSAANFASCRFDLIDLISQLQLCSLLNELPGGPLLGNDSYTFQMLEFDSSYGEFSRLYSLLTEYTLQPWSIQFEIIANET